MPPPPPAGQASQLTLTDKVDSVCVSTSVYDTVTSNAPSSSPFDGSAPERTEMLTRVTWSLSHLAIDCWTWIRTDAVIATECGATHIRHKPKPNSTSQSHSPDLGRSAY